MLVLSYMENKHSLYTGNLFT